MQFFLPYIVSNIGEYKLRTDWLYINRDKSNSSALSLVDYSQKFSIHIENKVNHFLARPVGYQDCKVTYLDELIIDFSTKSEGNVASPKKRFEYYIESLRPLSEQKKREIEEGLVEEEIDNHFPGFLCFFDSLLTKQELQKFKRSYENQYESEVLSNEFIFPVKFDGLDELNTIWKSLFCRDKGTFNVENSFGDIEFVLSGWDREENN